MGNLHKYAELAAGGIAVCLTCSGIDEVLALAHRVVCMREGRIVAERPREELDEALALAIISAQALCVTADNQFRHVSNTAGRSD